MALAFDSADAGAQNNAASSLTFSHTCTGSDLILCVGTGQGTFGNTTPTATYNAVSMTQKGTALRTTGGGYDLKTTGFYLVNPATGANNIVVTYGGSGEIAAGGVSFTGNDVGGTPVGTEQTGSGGTDPSSLSLSSAADEIIFSICFCAQPTIAVNDGETSRIERENINFIDALGIGTKTGAGTVTTGWTFGAGGISDDWSAVAFPIKPAGGGAVGQPTTKRFAGVPFMRLGGTAFGYGGSW